MKEQNHKRILELSKNFHTDKHTKILDLGSGDGLLIMKIRDLLKLKTKQCHTVEIHIKRKQKLKERGFPVQSFDLNSNFPYEDNEFNYIIANQIIEHLYFTDNFMQEIKRVLKPEGTLILSSTNLAALHYRITLLLGFMPNGLHPSRFKVGNLIKTKGKNPELGHKSVFTGKALKEFTQMHGFKVTHYNTTFGIGKYVDIMAVKT